LRSNLTNITNQPTNPFALSDSPLPTQLNPMQRRTAIRFSGALGTWAATSVGNFPWSFAYNWLDNWMTKRTGFMKLVRNGVIGLISSAVSDVCSNSIRVVTVKMQTHDDDLG
jgi:hypothetical protein